MPRLLLRPLALLALAACAVALGGCNGDEARLYDVASEGPEPLASLAFQTETGDARAFLLGDRRGTYFLDRATAPQDQTTMGLLTGGFRMLDGWRWWFPEDSLGLGPEDLREAVVRPDFAVRRYLERDTLGFLPGLVRRAQGYQYKRLTERIAVADGALILSVGDSLGTVDLFPALSDRPSDGYTVEREGNVLLIARSNYMAARADNPRRVWLAMASNEGRPVTRSVNLADRYPQSLGVRERATAPARLRLTTPATVSFATGDTPEEAAEAARAALGTHEAALDARRQQFVRALGGNTLVTEDDNFNRALAWARVTLDQLTVEHEDGSWDLVPGVPGAEAQPGWNMLEAVEGAFLSTGRWEEAADMLRRYGNAMRFDQRIDVFGRAPSRFENGQPRYRTADAQAAYVGLLGDYLRTTGNANLVLSERRLFWTNPVFAQRGFDDTRQLRTEGGFIRNEVNQTWIQQGTTRDVTVRGPESVDVQARYLHNLRTMPRLARIMGVTRQANEYTERADDFERRLTQTFVRGEEIGDFRSGDGQIDGTPRPSALVALRRLNLDPETERRILRRLAEQLALPHGVASRPQDDRFHPFLEAEGVYPASAGRYDGTVWTAFSGPLISLLAQHGARTQAAEQHAHLQHLLLERGVVGGIAENLDAHPRDGESEPALGGAPVQPYTLAEFIRTSFQDLAGIRYVEGTDIVLEPRLPGSWGRTETTFRVGNGSVRATIENGGGELRVSLVPQGQLPRGAQVRVRGHGQEAHVALVREGGETALPADSTALVLSSGSVTRNGESVQADATYTPPDSEFWDGFAWADATPRDSYTVMEQAEEARQLDSDDVTRNDPNARIIVAQTDPTGDDWGRPATFTYPSSFPPRILDATYFEIAEDRDYFYFRIEMAALADPEEFGFQPTFVAIVLDTEEGGQRRVGRNALFDLPSNRGYQYVIFVGDGLRIEDARGTVLGEFPRLGAGLLDLPAATMRFSLPKTTISALPRGTQITVLVGANEGGGIGTFRTVAPTASERFGGGKTSANDPNVYDVVQASVR